MREVPQEGMQPNVGTCPQGAPTESATRWKGDELRDRIYCNSVGCVGFLRHWESKRVHNILDIAFLLRTSALLKQNNEGREVECTA